MSRSKKFNPAKAAAIALGAPAAAFGAFYGGMHAAHELYSKKVWATPEEERMTLPGDDLVVDPNGYDTLRITQSRGLDAPLEEVWKHIYQMDTCKAGFYSWMNFERAFGMNVDNAYSIQEMWRAPDELHERMAVLPELRWSRDLPRVESIRASFTDDPAWPPAPGEEYVPPIEENNAKKGWTLDTPAENEAKALAKQEALMRELGML